MDLPESATRVQENTEERINRRIQAEIRRRIYYYQEHPEEIQSRLEELDEEWDVERALQANASTLSLVGLGLGLTANRKCLFLPVVVAGFLLQHALQGWCPPLPILRRLGFRTRDEINQERYAMKALRGDFSDVQGEERVEAALAAVRAR